MLAAGLTPTSRQRWSAKRVLEAIHEAFPEGISDEHNRVGKDLLVAAAIKYCGSWRKALSCRRPAGSRGSRPSRGNGVRNGSSNSCKMPMCKARRWWRRGFATLPASPSGGLAAGMPREAAGISAGSPAKPCNHWTADKVLREIQAGQHDKSDPPLSAPSRSTFAARRYFGSWRRAKITAQVFLATAWPKRQKKMVAHARDPGDPSPYAKFAFTSSELSPQLPALWRCSSLLRWMAAGLASGRDFGCTAAAANTQQTGGHRGAKASGGTATARGKRKNADLAAVRHVSSLWWCFSCAWRRDSRREI